MSQSSSSTAKTSPDQSTPRSPWLLVLIFRLLLLGVGGGLALIAGILLAYFYPAPNPEKPLLLKVLERLDTKPPATSPGSPSPAPVSSLTTTSSPLQLTPVQQQQAQAQLTQLQAQLKAVSDGVVTLEAQLGTSRPNESLEARLNALSLQLQGLPAPSADASEVSSRSANQLASSSDSLIQGDKLKVTLPSDVLFEESNSILRPEAGLILDKIVADLRDYPSSTIRIAAHTDASLEAEENRELSFRRAQAVQQYLARALGDEYRWLVAGYGGIRPLVANDTAPNQQRNRRIEIAVN
ncbi:MAG: OmpA family protein [Coleofasciculus sp. S288]|nr:OmpA family protein [Coleofasciculus sp. S288]